MPILRPAHLKGVIWMTECLSLKKYIKNIVIVAVRVMLWILMICWYIHIYFSTRIHSFLKSTLISSVIYLLTNIRYTNFAQHSIVLQLSREHQHVCVVGDDAQSIYSFRGANIENILKFTKLYDNVKLFKLEQNYRSTKTIVHAANSLIEKNSQQIRKEIFSEKSVGDPIEVVNAYSDVEEGEIVSRKILAFKRKENYSYDDFAVLYRTNAQSRIFEEMFRKKSIPTKSMEASLSIRERR